MTETEYVVRRFSERFAAFRGRRVLLHGSREYARAILEAYDAQYRFLGVMTDEDAGETFAGKRVFPAEELPGLDVDLIVLTERVKYAEAAYEKLAPLCREKGIALYDMYGLDQIALHDELDACGPQSAAGWQRIAAPYPVLALELMDTVLARELFRSEPAPRSTLLPLVRERLAQGRPVVFSLRKSCPEEEQTALLWKTGLFSSREEMEGHLLRRCREDLSFRALRERYPDEPILYIGMGLVNECILPRCYGIQTYRLMPFLDAAFPKRPAPAAAEEENRRERLEAALQACDAVSFDVFDTLLQRLTLAPTDVFRLVEESAARCGAAAPGFAEQRVLSERERPMADLDGVYRRLGERTGWPEETLRALRQREIETERAVIEPRGAVVELLEKALAMGKRVVLTSDMYLPEPLLRGLLEEKGVHGFERLFVSCDRGRRKAAGLFEEVRAYLGDARVLHIGDDPDADIAPALAAGCAAFWVPSALRAALDAGWEGAVRTAESLMERCLVGMSVAEAFADPFQPSAIAHTEPRARLRRFACGALAPMVAGFLTWLAREMRASGVERVLFLARDGYLPMRGYALLRRRFPEMQLPGETYFYANRRAALLGVACELARGFHFDRDGLVNGFSPDQILARYLALPPEAIEPWRADEEPEAYIERHMDAIRAVQEETRRGYVRYGKRLGLTPGARCAVVDFVAQGSTQGALERFLPLDMRGYYFARPWYENNGMSCPACYYLCGENDFLLRNYLEAEHFMTAPEPSMDRMLPDGEPRLAEEARSGEDLGDVSAVLREAVRFTARFIDLFYVPGEVIRPALPEEMYAADGYHWVMREFYDDWSQSPVGRK